MGAKILITAQIRNIDIHLLQVSERKFKVIWTKTGTNIEGLLYKNYISRCKDKQVSPSSRYVISEGAIKVVYWNPLPFVETTSAYQANRRFKLICRAAQDPRVNFEQV